MPTARLDRRPPPSGSAVGRGITLTGLLASLTARSSYHLSDQAEDIARYALWRAPATRDSLISVLRWSDWVRQWNIDHPARVEQGADRGIDMVATYRDGRCTAVQVKLRTGGARVGVGWEELATFAAKSATEPFTDRLLVLLPALDAVGFVWDPGAEDFARGVAALQAYVAAHGAARVPQKHRTEDGFALGKWLHNRREDRKGERGQVTAERIAALDALAFVW